MSTPALRFIIAVIFSASLILSCGTTSRSKRPVSTKPSPGPSVAVSTSKISVSKKNMKALETGVASWYGPNFHGKLTANGETYDMDGFTAAHRTLPFNTEVLVENLDNGKTVKVRINDRGPFAKERIIDLSRAAANQVDMIGPGTARVRIYLTKGDIENSRVTNLKIANYTVQLGSFADEAAAKRQSSQIPKSRVEKAIINNKVTYRVYYGLYQDFDKAQDALDDLSEKGFEGFVKQIENH